jgi:hypothetical protein
MTLSNYVGIFNFIVYGGPDYRAGAVNKDWAVSGSILYGRDCDC